jgi:hypothetical protein
MATATITLSSGTVVSIEGTVDEVDRLLKLHEVSDKPHSNGVRDATRRASPPDDHNAPSVPIHEIVNHAHSCDQAEKIERYVLDSRSQVDRTLLPLFIVHAYLEDKFPLAAAEIAEICKQLRVPVVQENVSKMLRESASKFVMLESVGPPKRFKLNRRGLEYMTALLSGRRDGSKSQG